MTGQAQGKGHDRCLSSMFANRAVGLWGRDLFSFPGDLRASKFRDSRLAGRLSQVYWESVL